KLAQSFAGHASASMTLDTYSHLFNDDSESVAEALATIVDDVRDGATAPGVASELHSEGDKPALSPSFWVCFALFTAGLLIRGSWFRSPRGLDSSPSQVVVTAPRIIRSFAELTSAECPHSER